MHKGSPSKMSRKELEESCEQLIDLVEKLTSELEAKDKHIKLLSVNARNWSKKYYADQAKEKIIESAPTTNNDISTNSSAAVNEQLLELQKALEDSEAEKKQAQQLAKQLNSSNVKLLKKLKALRIEVSTAKTIQSKLDEKQQTDSKASPLQETDVTENENNPEPEMQELEFSPEMQQTLAKYAA